MNLLITGAASGIGYASVKRMASKAHVIAADLDRDRLADLAEDVGRDGLSISVATVEVGDAASVRQMMSWIEANVGTVDALFNNAGITFRSSVDSIAEADWDRVIDVHVKGAYLCMKAVLPGMCAAKRGAIVNMSSDYAVMGMPGSAVYAAAKTAVYSLTKSVATEFAPYGIRINALGPGPIDTPILRVGRSADEWVAAEDNFKKRIPMGRLGRPDEVAAVLDFLLSDRSSYMTGQIIHPNGGQLSW